MKEALGSVASGPGWRGRGQSKSWPNVADPNPIVVVYRDPNMKHTGFTASRNRYFHEKEVWRFFGYHPRVAR
jgi:hypothetical protein